MTGQRTSRGGRRALRTGRPGAGLFEGTVVEHPLGWRLELAAPPPQDWLGELLEWAAADGALDLRVAGVDPRAWASLGFAPLAPGCGELVRPVPQRLDGVEATQALGARLARVLRPGDLVVLSGPLGAGKTALTQGLAGALGARGPVTSPTFVLARSYPGTVPLLHVDAYRLRAAGNAVHLDDLDLDAALDDAVTVVEWGEGVVEHLAEAWLAVRLDRPQATADDVRTATVRAHGARWSVTD